MPYERHKEYLSDRVLTATPVELIRILYEGAIQAVDQAVTALRSGDIQRRGQSITKAIEILSELRISLRHEGLQEAYANTLAGLYGYMQRQLIRAHSEQSENPMQEVARLLNTLLEGWIGAMENMASQAQPQGSVEAREQLVGATASNPYSADGPALDSGNRSWQF